MKNVSELENQCIELILFQISTEAVCSPSSAGLRTRGSEFTPSFKFSGVWSYVCVCVLAVPALSCGTRDPLSLLQCADSLVAACKLSVVACRVLFPNQGQNPASLHWELGVLTPGPPGKSLILYIFLNMVPRFFLMKFG